MKTKITYGVIFLLLCVAATLSALAIKQSKKIGYVTTMKAFEEFGLKKELERDYKNTQMAKQAYLDSLKLTIQKISLSEKGSQGIDDARINELKKVYFLREEQFNKENETLFEKYNEQIWQQLNQYIADYGKEKGYDYLLGASGQGAVMYANSGEDLTKEIIHYVNDKYNGKTSK